MTYYYVSQEVYIEPYQPSLDWMRDIVLAAPLLEGPKDQSTLCRETAFTTDTGVIVKWLAINGAAFYVVQWCNNSSFTGPTLKAIKTADIYYNLQFGTDIRIGEEVFWRVMAFNSSTGAVSGKSEVWQFIYDCSKMGGNLPANQNQQPDGGGGSGVQGSLCDEFNVSVKIKGPEGIMCCDKNMWHVLITYDCEASDGTPVVMSGVTWEIKQSGTAVHTVLLANNNLVVIYSNPGAGDDVSEKFTIKAKVLFTVGLTTFECVDEFRVTMDCDTGRPTVKPWMKLGYSGYGVRQYTDPGYIGSSLGYMDTYFSTVFPHLGGSTSAIATGPVIQVGLTRGLPEGPPYCACDERIDSGDEESVVHEARVHIPLGCGLEVVGGSIAVNNDILVGPGLIAWGTCGLQIDTDWLDEYGYGGGYTEDCYTLGCGLKTVGTTLLVNSYDLAGTGLITEGVCGLAVDCSYIADYCGGGGSGGYTAGCGITLTGNEFSINPADLAGDCLEVYGYGCALQVQSALIEVVTDVYCENNEIYKVTEIIRVLDC